MSLTSDEADLITSLNNKDILFPEGLPAFEQMRNFVLVVKDEDLPFLWLQSVECAHLAFVVIDPFLIDPDYEPDVLDEDVASLEIESPEDAMILGIVNMKQSDNKGPTLNLVGPIIINWKKKIGKQVIIKNHTEYTVKHPLQSDT